MQKVWELFERDTGFRTIQIIQIQFRKKKIRTFHWGHSNEKYFFYFFLWIGANDSWWNSWWLILKKMKKMDRLKVPNYFQKLERHNSFAANKISSHWPLMFQFHLVLTKSNVWGNIVIPNWHLQMRQQIMQKHDRILCYSIQSNPRMLRNIPSDITNINWWLLKKFEGLPWFIST